MAKINVEKMKSERERLSKRVSEIQKEKEWKKYVAQQQKSVASSTKESEEADNTVISTSKGNLEAFNAGFGPVRATDTETKAPSGVAHNWLKIGEGGKPVVKTPVTAAPTTTTGSPLGAPAVYKQVQDVNAKRAELEKRAEAGFTTQAEVDAFNKEVDEFNKNNAAAHETAIRYAALPATPAQVKKQELNELKNRSFGEKSQDLKNSIMFPGTDKETRDTYAKYTKELPGLQIAADEAANKKQTADSNYETIKQQQISASDVYHSWESANINNPRKGENPYKAEYDRLTSELKLAEQAKNNANNAFLSANNALKQAKAYVAYTEVQRDYNVYKMKADNENSSIDYSKISGEFVGPGVKGDNISYNGSSDFLKKYTDTYSTTVDSAVKDLSKYGTQEQKNIYLYLYTEKGSKAASDYAKTINPLIAEQAYKATKQDYTDSGKLGRFGMGVGNSFLGGLAGDFVYNMEGVARAIIGDTSYHFQNTAQRKADAVSDAETNPAAKFGMAAVRTTGAQTPMIVLGLATGGLTSGMSAATGLAKAGVKAISKAPQALFFASAFGGSYSDAINKGNGYWDSVGYGMAVASLELATEKMFDIPGIYGGSKADDVIKSAVSKGVSRLNLSTTGKNVLTFTGYMAANGLGEGFEEGISELFTPALGNAFLNENNKMLTEEHWEQITYAYALGFAASALMGSMSSVSTYREAQSNVAVASVLNGSATSDSQLSAILSDKEAVKLFKNATGFKLSPIESVAKMQLAAYSGAVAAAGKSGKSSAAVSDTVKGVTGNNVSELVDNASKAVPVLDADFVKSETEAVEKMVQRVETEIEKTQTEEPNKDLSPSEAIRKAADEAAMETFSEFERSSTSEKETDESVKKAQTYNITVSNLKRKAEELGLLDNNFFTALQNVNLYNPTASDKALISSEFKRIFAGNTDPLVASWLNGIGINTQNSTSINEQNKPVSAENLPVNEDVTYNDVYLTEGEILSIKHTRNVFSLFKGAEKIVVGKDFVSNGIVAMPLSDDTLAGVKSVVGDVIQNNQSYSIDRIYHKDNDVVISGNPKVGEVTIGNKKLQVYSFKIGDTFYTCEQKYIDAFNNGTNIITANKQTNVPWTVHDKNGNLVAIFSGIKNQVTEESYNQLQSVSELIESEKQRKAENADKPFNQTEINMIARSSAIPRVLVDGETKYITDGSIALRTDDEGIAIIEKVAMQYHTLPDGISLIPANRAKEMLNNNPLGDVTNFESHSVKDRNGKNIMTTSVCVIDNIAHNYNKKFVDAIKKRSKTMKILSGGTLNSTMLVGYDAAGEVIGFALPLSSKDGNYTDKNGKVIPFATDRNIKAAVEKMGKNVAETSESVTEPTESVIKKAESVTETPETVTETEEITPVGQLLEDYDNTVDNILSVSDETAKEFADKRVAVEVLKNTPSVILDNVEDAKDLKVIINYNKLYLAVRKSGVFKGHYHNLGTEIAKMLPEFLKTPDAIIQLSNGRLNLFATVATERGNNGIVSVELNSTKDINGKYEDYNVVVTMFSSDDNYAQNLISGDGVTEKYKREDLSQVNPQLYKWLAIINDKSSTNDNIPQNEVVVNSSVRTDAENDAVKLTDKCELVATKHTSTGNDIWVVTLKDRLSAEEYKDLSSKVKSVGGYYSRFAKTPDGKAIPGFLFKSQPTSEAIKVFNDFFGNENSKETTSAVNTYSETSEEVLNNQPESDTIKRTGTKPIAKYVASMLANGKKISAVELIKVANAAFGGTMADNAYTIKDAYDAMELGVNQHILSMKDVSTEKMLEILELLPTQTKRTEEMVKFQQFSTPPSIAYLANYAANVNANDIMLEPSAGIGGIAVFAKKDGAKVYVNELDNRRLDILKNMPFDGFYNENAEQLDNILGGEIEPTVIVMNPPFSSSSERNMQNTKIGAKHIEQALKILAPNGRLVAIVGHGMADGAPAFRNWWKDIKSQYNVKANIGVNGKNYNKYGTNFDIQVLVIDKNGPTTQTETGYVDTLQDLQDKLGGIRNERPIVDYSSNEQRTSANTRTETIKTSETTDIGNSVVSDAGSVTDKRKSANNSSVAKRTEQKGVQSADGERGISAGSESGNSDVMADTDGGLGTGQQSGPVGNQNTSGVNNNDSGQSDIQTRRAEHRKRVKHKELTDSIFEHYQTQPLRMKNTRPHPAKVSESAAMSAIEPPAITYKPTIPQSIVENGVLSDVQLEAISYAGQSHSQTLPNGNTRGFFLGDGTGIGKGRTIAGMMLDNYNQGRKKAVWVTLNSSLVNDAKRDVKALFGNSDLVTQFVGGNKADGVLNTDEAIMVISYSALSKGFDNSDSNFEKIVKWLGKDFDGLIVFDEAHKMGNATATKGTRGVKKASQTGLAGIALQEALPKAKIVYSSATGATEVENLRYAERLGLWGEGTAFVTGDDFVSKIKAGGLAAMELIARDMKAMGVYLSRNISYEDVRYDKITHKLTAQQRKIYDELARSWQIVLNNINKALDTTNQSKDGTAKGRALGAFWSSQQRFFNQILTSMQVPSVIADIEKQLADGKSCVIQLVSTNEAAQNEEFARLKAEDLELDEFDLIPKQMLMSYIENSFPVQQFEEYRDDEGNVRSKPVYDSKGNPVLNREALRQREDLLAKLGSIKVPSSPIDMIINHFGTDLVAENTGRARRVVQKNGVAVEEKIGSKKDADVDAFQNGNKRIIIFSKAGGTGKSYHADRAAKNQQQRVHYLLEAGWQADNAVQGFGRSHRSNQASAPIFKLVTTDLKGQMRFISTIAKRLDQLGAMTKGQRQAGGQGMFSASDNLENSFAADVLAVFYKDLASNRVDGINDGLAILEKLGLKNKILDEYNRIIPTAPELREVNKFLNRILSLESSEQNTVFDGYSQRLQDATEKAMLAGTLDKGLENYKADRITLNEVQDIKEDERSGAKTKYYNLTAEHKIKPVNFDDIQTDNKNFVGFYQNKTTGNIRAVMKTSSTTDQYGNVTDNYKLIGQSKNEYVAQNRFYGNWTKLEVGEAEKLWNEEVSKLPEYRKENLHLISGVVLPVWDKLPTENVRIYRVLTSDGEMLIGRVISEDMIDTTLHRLGSSRTKEHIKTADLIAGIKNGDTVHLENEWKIVQRKVSGENRIEIVGPSYEHYDLLTKKGVFTERIQFNTRYFIPANTNTESIIDAILDISPVMRVENVKYSTSESEDFDYERRNLLSDDGGKRTYSAGAGKQAKRMDGRTSRYRERRGAAYERRKYCQTLKAAGDTEQRLVHGHRCEVIPTAHYTNRMKKITEKNKKDGFDETIFITGGAKIPLTNDSKGNIKTARGVLIKNNDKKIVIVQYDNEFFMPEQINDHEKAHDKYKSQLTQKVKNIILNSLSVTEKNDVLKKLSRDYNGIIQGNEEAIFEEFIANVLSDMDYTYLGKFAELQKAYWKNNVDFIDNYKVSEYTTDTDAGGVNDDILDALVFENHNWSTTNNVRDNFPPMNEYPHSDTNELATRWAYKKEIQDFTRKIVYFNNEKYLIEKDSQLPLMYRIVLRVADEDARVSERFVDERNNDNERNQRIQSGGKRTVSDNEPNRRLDRNRHGNVRDSSNSDKYTSKTGSLETMGEVGNGEWTNTDGRVQVVEQSVGDKSLYVKYSFDSAETDTAELTPERQKEIFEQFEKDRAELPKPSKISQWGERAAWVAHNMTRVFPNIPERGERGTFFAEFRKSMIQWKNLPTTASFMVQDKLNKMTEALTPSEYKTFSELVYFLDLQEEAQIQKDKGYTEILLPNEITAGEVDAIVDVLNEEATDNVRQALMKRQNIWSELKDRYIALNRYIGFDTDGKFKRKNYYHHQVIEYMNGSGKGTGSREIGIKAGRGWLKERQGSTKAINTDFLAVEYKAMLQMQYDIYIAETLGRIKKQYDIKPQLEKQALEHNKAQLNDIIASECTDNDGNVRLDSNGKPDSETYRQTKWYNSRIMFGFSGLFDLAERGELSDFNGEYSNVVNALKQRRMNVDGLYSYVGVLAGMELSDNATDAEEQSVVSARTVLKYTSQKRQYLKELLGSEYQTWESLADDMSDTHTVHQPRRGNYFYTKTVIDEDAFSRAHAEMINQLVSGDVDLGNTDLNTLFNQYADTVRLTGAAYEQWVLPNEIVDTMSEIANPKQASEGAKAARSIISAWKGWATSVNPLRTVKFGIRNIFGDLDAVIAGNPKVVIHSKRAVHDIYQAMRYKNYSADFMEWVERGGYTSMIFANEMDTEMQDKLFSHLKDKEGMSIFRAPVKAFEKYYNGVENAHNFREAILRYSSYLYFKEAIKRNSGNVKDYVSSNRFIVRGLNSVEDKAYQLSKDLLGAYDEVGKMGQTLRRYWVPFYSFTETNLKRYYRMFENIITSDDRIPEKAGKLLLKALMVNLLGLLMAAWNRLVMKEEDDKLPPSARNVPHITLGRIGDDIYAFRQLGSFSELLEWFGLEDYKWTKEDLMAPVDKAWGMVTPFLKMPVELVSGLNFYPSLSNPSSIRDKWQHFFNSFGVDDIYDVVTGKPTKGISEILKGAVSYNYDYKESSYYEILDIKREYQKKTDNTIYGADSKSNALYYMKKAVRYKDKKAALKYLDEYFNNGGTVRGIKQSFSTLNPMYGFTSKDTLKKGEAFIATLTDEQKEKLKIAQEFYENDLMLPETVLNALGKKNITNEEAKAVLKGYINAKCK